MQKHQTGFTLVEIAIVLVVIGLLLGGALKGQELIHSAKVKNLANDLRNIPILIYTYQDRFRALPGDDPQATSHLGSKASNASTPNTGLGNAAIDGSWNSTTQTDESYLFWQHVRLAGLIAGGTTPGDAAYPMRNAEGGLIGITSGSHSPITTLSGTYITCSQGISGRYAKQIDGLMDDGNGKQGSIQVMANPSGPQTDAASAVETPNDNDSYTVCYAF